MGDYPTTADGVASEEANDNELLENYLNMVAKCVNQARNEMEKTFSDLQYVRQLAQSCQMLLEDIIAEVGE